MRKKIFVSAVAVALVLCCVIGGTLAWLTDKTDSVVNTFTVGKVDIELTESLDLDLKMVPGRTITKDPKVTVKADSEDCWLFVQVDASENFAKFMTYTMATDWDTLEGQTGVFYRKVTSSESEQDFFVLADNQVTVRMDVTEAMMESISKDPQTAPTLTFTAYAVQLHKSNDKEFSAAEAWAETPAATPAA